MTAPVSEEPGIRRRPQPPTDPKVRAFLDAIARMAAREALENVKARRELTRGEASDLISAAVARMAS